MHQSSRIELNDCVRHLMSICGDDQSAHSPGFPKMWQPRDGDWSVFSEIIIPKGALASVEQAWPGTIAMMAKAAMTSSCGPVLPLVALCDDLAGMSLDALTINGHDSIIQIAASSMASNPARFEALNAIAPTLCSLSVDQLFSDPYIEGQFIDRIIKVALLGHGDALAAIASTLGQASSDQIFEVFDQSTQNLFMLINHALHNALTPDEYGHTSFDFAQANAKSERSVDLSETNHRMEQEKVNALDFLEQHLNDTAQGSHVARRTLDLLSPSFARLTHSHIMTLEANYQKIRDKADLPLGFITTLIYGAVEGSFNTAPLIKDTFKHLSFDRFILLEQSDHGFIKPLVHLLDRSHHLKQTLHDFHDDYRDHATRWPLINQWMDYQQAHLHQRETLVRIICETILKVVHLDDLLKFDEQSPGLIDSFMHTMLWHQPFPDSRAFVVALLAHHVDRYWAENHHLNHAQTMPSFAILATGGHTFPTIASGLLSLDKDHPGFIKKTLMVYNRPYPGHKIFVAALEKTLTKAQSYRFQLSDDMLVHVPDTVITKDHLKKISMLSYDQLDRLLFISALRILTIQLGDLSDLISAHHAHSHLIHIEHRSPGTIITLLQSSAEASRPYLSLQLLFVLLCLHVDLAWIEQRAPGTIRLLLQRCDQSPSQTLMLFGFSLVMGDLYGSIYLLEPRAPGTVHEIAKAAYGLTLESELKADLISQDMPEPAKSRFHYILNEFRPVHTNQIGTRLCAIVQQFLKGLSFDELCGFIRGQPTLLHTIRCLSADRAQHAPLLSILDCLVDASKAACDHSSDAHVLMSCIQVKIEQLPQPNSSVRDTLCAAADQYVNLCVKSRIHIPESYRLFSIVSKTYIDVTASMNRPA